MLCSDLSGKWIILNTQKMLAINQKYITMQYFYHQRLGLNLPISMTSPLLPICVTMRSIRYWVYVFPHLYLPIRLYVFVSDNWQSKEGSSWGDWDSVKIWTASKYPYSQRCKFSVRPLVTHLRKWNSSEICIYKKERYVYIRQTHYNLFRNYAAKTVKTIFRNCYET